MYCSNCGKQITDGTRYCGNCGSPVGFVQPAAVRQTDEGDSTVFILGVISLVTSFSLSLVSVVLSIIAIVLASKSKSALGYEARRVKQGRICAIIALIIAIVSAIIAFFFPYLILWFVTALFNDMDIMEKMVYTLPRFAFFGL